MSDFELALRQNIATNGRWFCAMMFALALATGSHALAFAFAAMVGLSCITDQLGELLRPIVSLGVYALTVILSVVLLIAIW